MTPHERPKAMLAQRLVLVTLLVFVVAAPQAALSVEQPGSERAIRYGFTGAVIGEANPNDVLAATLVWARGVIAQIGF